jgi:hypothetical protein
MITFCLKILFQNLLGGTEELQEKSQSEWPASYQDVNLRRYFTNTVFWVVTPHSDIGYQRFRVKMEAASSSQPEDLHKVMVFWTMTQCRTMLTSCSPSLWSTEMLVSSHTTTRCHNSEDHSMNLHCHENLKSHKSQTSYCSANCTVQDFTAMRKRQTCWSVSLCNLKRVIAGKHFGAVQQMSVM